MKHFLLSILTIIAISACTRAASTPAPTGLPLDFPTPIPLQCQSADLLSSTNSSGTTDTLILGVTLTNQTKNTCVISNPAKVTLLTSSGEPYDVQTVVNPAIQTPSAPSNLLVTPAESAILTVIGSNFCLGLPTDSLILRIWLSDKQTMDVPLKIPSMPPCEASSKVSTITVIPYSDPP